MYKDYIYVLADRLARFGGTRFNADGASAFCLPVSSSSTYSDACIGGRLIMFGD